MSKLLTTEQFIQKAVLCHGDKYDYSLVEYKNSQTKVKIICKECSNIFLQKPNDHLSNHGCPICGKKNKNKKSTEDFIKEAKLIHGDKYDYSLVDYKNNSTKVKIICKNINHKGFIFLQSPKDHLNNHGCPKCVNKYNYSLEEIIRLFISKFNNLYNYSQIKEYKNNSQLLPIICNTCNNIFYQSFDLHYNREHGCPYCKSSKGERLIQSYLIKSKIDYFPQKTFPDLLDKGNLSYDFYIPSTNLLIEMNGEQHYKWKKQFQPTLHDFHRQLHHDWLKRKYAKKNNINLLIIKYNQLKEIKKILDKVFIK